MFIVAQKNSTHGALLVVTDFELIGKKFEDEKLQLDLSKPFYQGEEKSKEETKKLIEKARHVHLTGKNSVCLGVEMDIIDGNRILMIKGIPHAEALLE